MEPSVNRGGGLMLLVRCEHASAPWLTLGFPPEAALGDWRMGDGAAALIQLDRLRVEVAVGRSMVGPVGRDPPRWTPRGQWPSAAAAEGAFQRPLEAGAGEERMEARGAREAVKLAGPVGEHDAVVLHPGVAIGNGPTVLVPSC
jgi:hypothetical protein